MIQTVTKFETLTKLVTKACDPMKPTLEKSLEMNRKNHGDSFMELCQALLPQDLSVLLPWDLSALLHWDFSAFVSICGYSAWLS